MKKAGIIIGILVILIAIILFGVSQIIEKKNIEKVNKLPDIEVNTGKNQENVSNETPSVTEKVVEVEKIVEKTISAVSTINKNTLDKAIIEKEEVVVIADKRLLLLDENYGEKHGKMLSYCFDVLTSDNTKLVLFMTAKSYDSYKIGDKLLVKYEIYKNINDVSFPVVLSVSAISD